MKRESPALPARACPPRRPSSARDVDRPRATFLRARSWLCRALARLGLGRVGRSACILALAGASSAAAQAPERVALVLPDCTDTAAWQRDVLELLRVELQVDHAAQIDVADAGGGEQQLPALWVQRECAAGSGGPLQLRSSDPVRGSLLERSLTLHDVPRELQSRVVAIALAELLRASWRTDAVSGVSAAADSGATESGAEHSERTEAARSKEPGTEGDATLAEHRDTELTRRADSSAVEERSAQLRPISGIVIGLGPALHISLRGAPVLYGAQLSLSWWRLSVGALGYLGSVSDAIGDIAFERLHGFAAFDALQLQRGRWIWSAAVSGSAGGTFANAHALGTALSTGSTDFSWDGSIETALALRFDAAWSLRVRASLGLAYSPAYRADDRVIADYSGLFTAVSLSLAHAPF